MRTALGVLAAVSFLTSRCAFQPRVGAGGEGGLIVGSPGSHELGASTEILTGIPKAGSYNGWRIAARPDGGRYATVGDAQNTGAAQDANSSSARIPRSTLDAGRLIACS